MNVTRSLRNSSVPCLPQQLKMATLKKLTKYIRLLFSSHIFYQLVFFIFWLGTFLFWFCYKTGRKDGNRKTKMFPHGVYHEKMSSVTTVSHDIVKYFILKLFCIFVLYPQCCSNWILFFHLKKIITMFFISIFVKILIIWSINLFRLLLISSF